MRTPEQKAADAWLAALAILVLWLLVLAHEYTPGMAPHIERIRPFEETHP